MACSYTYKGKEYNAAEFIRVLADMTPETAAKYMPGVKSLPNAPFVSRTEDWAGLAIKRAIRYAVENSYDRISWDTGATNAERYDLSKQVEEIEALRNKDGTYSVIATPNGGNSVSLGKNLTPEQLAENIGKEMAEKIVNQGNGEHTYRGLDLKVGGQGMIGFYDRIMPATVGKLIKKFGGKVTSSKIDSGTDKPPSWTEVDTSTQPRRGMVDVHGFDITPAMRDSVMQGQALFEQRQVYAQRQLPLRDPYATLKVRDGTRPEQLETGRAALADIEARIFGRNATGVFRGATVLGSRLSKDFREQGHVDLVGQQAKTPADVALLSQVLRNKFETLRILYTDAADNILGVHAYGSRMVGSAALPPSGIYSAEMKADMARLGATGYWPLHNHPTGIPIPSDADLRVTQQMASLVPGLKGHVIIDHNSYGYIGLDTFGRPNSYGELIQAPWLNNKDFTANSEVPHELLGKQLTNPDEVAKTLKEIQTKKGYLTIVATDSRGMTQFLMEVPAQNLTQPMTRMAAKRAAVQTKKALREAAVGGNVFAVVEAGAPRSLTNKLDYLNVFTDIITADGRSVATSHQQDLARSMASKREAYGRSGEMVRETADEPYMPLRSKNMPPTQRRGYQQIAQNAIDKWNEKIGWRWGALGKLPEQDEYLVARYKTLGHLTEIRETARHIFDALKVATEADQGAVYDYLTTRNANPSNIVDQKVSNAAQLAKQAIAEQGQRLFDAGLLTEEAMERFQGEYLPRMYLKHVLDDKMSSAMGMGKKLSDQGNLKARKDIPLEVRKFMLGEITDPAFLASFSMSRVGRDLAMMDFLDQVSKNERWAPQEMLVEWNGKNVSPFFIRSEAARLRKQANFVKDHPTAGTMRDIADRMDGLADRAVERMNVLTLDDYKQIPDRPAYGALRGLYVRKEIYEDLVGAQTFIDPGTFEALMQKTSGQIMRWFKFSKVGANLPSHFRNLYGNAMLLHLSGVPLHRVYSGEIFVKAISSIISKDQYWEIAKKYGLKESLFANVELARIRDEWLMMQESGQSGPAKLKAMFGRVGNLVGDLYQFEEAIGKLAKLRDAMEREGKSEAEAMMDAHKTLFDYSLVPRWVRWIRNSPLGVPFLTFTYKAIPRLAEAAIKTPWRYLPYIAIGFAIKELLKYYWDADEKEVDQVLKAAPNWMQQKGGMMLLPTKDEAGRMQALDLGYITPWGMLSDLARQGQVGDYSGMLSTLGVFSGPVPSVLAAVKTGRDPFTDKEIMPAGDPPIEKAKRLFSYAWDMAVPGMFGTTGFAGKAYDLATHKVDPRTGEEKLTAAQTMARLFGLTVYPFDPEATRQTNITFMRRDIQDIRTEELKRLRDKNLSDDDKDKIRQVFGDYIQQKQEVLDQYQQESEVAPGFTRDKAEHRDLSDLIGAVAPLIDGKRKGAAVSALKDAGHPALAALLEDMPIKPRPLVARALKEELAYV